MCRCGSVTHALTNGRYAFLAQLRDELANIDTDNVRTILVSSCFRQQPLYKLQLPHAACNSKQAVVTDRYV